MKNISVLGSTGSIGRNTLNVIRHLKEELQVVALAAGANLDLLEEQVREFHPQLVAIGDKDKALEFQQRAPHIPVVAGEEGLCVAAAFAQADMTVFAMSGTLGLAPAIAAIKANKQIALANKELLVSAGELITSLAKEHSVPLLPIDSEHSALFQCLKGHSSSEVRRLILTASGGPFRTMSSQELLSITVEQALSHPNWQMGKKITIDSSTLMNKGLEMIEARWLFDVEPSRIEVVIHPQSIIHSCVEFCDGSILAQMSAPDMIVPIQYALTYPHRKPGLLPPFDFLQHPQLTFEAPNRKNFLCLQLAEDALKEGKSYPCALNAANEVFVERFIRQELDWIEIGRRLEKLMSSHRPRDMLTLESIQAVDRETREIARTLS